MKKISLGFEIHHFDSTAYNFPVTFPKTLYVEFSPSMPENSLSLFIGSLLAFNELGLGQEFVTALCQADELALVGGLIFQEESRCIYPSCCLDFQKWRDCIDAIQHQKSPWLGHDPTPWIEFDEHAFTVWSDDPADDPNVYSIQFTQDELVHFEAEIFHTLAVLITRFQAWATQYIPDLSTQFVQHLSEYLLLDKRLTP